MSRVVSIDFIVGVTRTLALPTGVLDPERIGLDSLFADAHIRLVPLERSTPVLAASDLDGLDAIVIERARLPSSAIDDNDRMVLISRYGAGYDQIDVDACTRNGVIVTNAPDGVRRPMATVYLALILCLSLRMFEKDRLTRTGGWTEANERPGIGLMGRTLGLIGLGSIGFELLRLARPLGMRHLVHTRHPRADTMAAADAQAVSLPTLLAESDFVCLAVPLTESTRGMIGENELKRMKPTAFLVNAARGAIVDQAALRRALEDGVIRGAGLDVFETEPIDPADPLLSMDNVILSPHALGHTDEMATSIGSSVARAILAVRQGRRPEFVVNPQVLADPRLRERLDRLGLPSMREGDS